MVDPVVHRVDFRAEMGRVEPAAGLGGLAQVFGEEVVEFGVEHADDFAAFVADDGLALFVPEGWYGEASYVVRIGFVVELTELGEAVERVFRGGAMVSREEPSVLGEGKVAEDQLDDVL